MLNSLKGCFGLSSRFHEPGVYTDLEAGRNDPAQKQGCIFCQVSPDNGFDVVESVCQCSTGTRTPLMQ